MTLFESSLDPKQARFDTVLGSGLGDGLAAGDGLGLADSVGDGDGDGLASSAAAIPAHPSCPTSTRLTISLESSCFVICSCLFSS